MDGYINYEIDFEYTIEWLEKKNKLGWCVISAPISRL